MRGVLAAFEKFALISHDHTYPVRRNNQMDLAKEIDAKENVNKVWELFDTKPSGYNEESSFSNP